MREGTRNMRKEKEKFKQNDIEKKLTSKRKKRRKAQWDWMYKE